MWYAEWCECMVNDNIYYGSSASIHRVHDISPILPHVVADSPYSQAFSYTDLMLACML